MKTKVYNPSALEVEFAGIIHELEEQIQSKLTNGQKIISVTKKDNLDNPDLFIKVEDEDGDQHELVVRFIQRIEH